MNINRALWMLAEGMKPLKAGASGAGECYSPSLSCTGSGAASRSLCRFTSLLVLISMTMVTSTITKMKHASASYSANVETKSIGIPDGEIPSCCTHPLVQRCFRSTLMAQRLPSERLNACTSAGNVPPVTGPAEIVGKNAPCALRPRPPPESGAAGCTARHTAKMTYPWLRRAAD